MMLSAEAIRNHLQYSGWASSRLVSAAKELPADERRRDFGTADRTVEGTLAHIYKAERLWLARILGEPKPEFSPSDAEFNHFTAQWPLMQERWIDWARGLSDADSNRMINYQDLKGHPWTNPLWGIILHVVNHSTHHRGQVSGFLRSLGRTPPPLDFIAYMRNLGSNRAS